MKLIFTLIIIALLAIPFWLMYHPCLKEHKELINHPAWTQLIYIYKSWYPVYHPEETTLDTICDIRK